MTSSHNTSPEPSDETACVVCPYIAAGTSEGHGSAHLAIDANCACDVVALKVEDLAPKWVAATRLIETSPQGTFDAALQQ